MRACSTVRSAAVGINADIDERAEFANVDGEVVVGREGGYPFIADFLDMALQI